MLWIVDHPRPFFALVLLVLLAAVELGFRIRARRGREPDEHDSKHFEGTRNDLAVLLSLLLGFTLAMALVRFDQRAGLVMDEANAISTSRLRVEMLPEQLRGQVRESLRRYIEARVQYSRVRSQQEMQLPLRQAGEIQSELWREAATAAQQAPTPITALFISSLNEAFDLRDKRIATLEIRIPPALWFMLVFVALLTCLTVGYSHRRRLYYSMWVPPLAIALVMMLIADLDSSRAGLIRVRQHSIERLQSEAR
jgi:hypothetical protein